MKTKTPDTAPIKPRRSLLHRMWGLLPSLFVILLVGIIVILGNHIRTDSKVIEEKKIADLRQDRPKTNVVAMEMVPTALRQRINLPGVVQPWVKLKVVAEVRGMIVAKNAREGQRVKKGTILAKIDARDYQSLLASATASYEVAVSKQKRQEQLLKENVGTRARLDDIIATLKTSKASMDKAALDLDRCVVRAPMAGVVNRVHIEYGQYVDTEDPVVEILNIDRVKVEVGIPESDVDAVRHIEHFDVRIDALGAKVFPGSRHYLSNTADSFARLYNLEVAVENPDGEILPDMFARVDIVKQEIPAGLAVPLYALLNRNETYALYVLDNQVARQRPIEVGIQDGWRVEVRKGLSPGDQVVVVGQRVIVDGESVNVTRTVRSMEELNP